MVASVAGSWLLIAGIVAAVGGPFDSPQAGIDNAFRAEVCSCASLTSGPSPRPPSAPKFRPPGFPGALAQISTPPATDTALPVSPGSRTARYLSLAFLIIAPFTLFILWFGGYIRPGALARTSRRQLGDHPWFVWLFAGFVIFFTGVVGASLAYHSPLNRGLGLSLREKAVPQLGMYAAGTLAAYMMLRLLRSGAPGAGLGFAKGDLWKGLLALAAAFPLVAATGQISNTLHSMMTGVPPDPIAHESLRIFVDHSDDPWSWVLMGCAILGAPVLEESVFRACVQSAALKLTGHVGLSIVLATGVFTVSHWGAVPGHAFVPLAVLGIALGIAFERTKSLGVPIVMHMGFNAVNVALAMVL